MSNIDKFEFRNVVSSVFNNWSALQLTVDHGMGGSYAECTKKVSDMIDRITDICFSRGASDWTDVSDELEELMDQYFDTVLEDNSSDEVGQILWDFSRKWVAGDKESAQNYVKSLKNVPVNKSNSQELRTEPAPEQMDTHPDESVSNVIPSEKNSVQDEWTVVKSKKHRN